MSEYTVEWLMYSHAVPDELDKEAMLDSVAAELEGNVETGGPIRRLSGVGWPYVSIGTFFVSSGLLLIEIYKLLREREGSEVGVVKSTEGKYVFDGNFDKALVQEVGGNVIGPVEGDVILVEFSSDQLTEFNARRDEDEDSDASAENVDK